MIARSFYFLRHGETDANVQKILQGSTNTPLNDNGRAQAELAAIILKSQPIDRIVASPLLRAAETAEIVNRLLNKPLTFDARLQERHFGIYEGKNPEQIEQWKIENNYLNPPLEPETGYAILPDGEGYTPFRTRIVDAMREALLEHASENVLFVSHGAVFMTLHKHLLNENVKTKNANPYHFDYQADKWCLNCLVTQYEKNNAK